MQNGHYVAISAAVPDYDYVATRDPESKCAVHRFRKAFNVLT
jgi:hypothetical protein